MGVISTLGDAPGNPVIDRDVCTLCGACAAICPVEVLTIGDQKGIPGGGVLLRVGGN